MSANGSLSATEMESKWASVTDQSGIFAGKGGYDITVGNNTDLKGAVIASKAEDTGKNKLDTGTISFSDIKNKADFKVTHVAISGGTAGPGAPTAFKDSDSDSSTTKSAVEKGELIIRNQDQQKQDINGLSRDTDSANNPLKQIFDKQKELDKIETVELIKDIAQQAKSVVKKYDRIEAQKEVDKNKDALTRAEAEKRYKHLSDEEKAKYASFEQYYSANEDSIYYALVDTQLKANKDKNLGAMGGNVSKGIDTAMAIVTGVITGDITGSLAGASAPWIAEQIKLHTGHADEKGNWVTDDIAGNLIAHAILGAVVAELQGGPSIAGGVGAVAGELAAKLIREQLYGKDVKDLTEAEKQNISALAQLAAGLAIAAGGGDTGAAGAAIAAGKNAVENNYLNSSDHQTKESLKYKEKNGTITDSEKLKLLELQIKDESTTNALLEACVDANSQACATERQNAYDALKTYRRYTYLYPVETQIGYQEINHLLKSTSKEANELRSIYDGVVLSFQRWGYNEEDAQKMAGYYMGSMMTVHGVVGAGITLPRIQKVFGNTKQLIGKTATNAGKGTAANKPLDKTDLELQHGKGNVEQGGGNYKETKDKILDNQAANQKANESSKFGENVAKEQQINAGKGASASSNPIINPATNKVVTEHIIVSSGKAPHTSTPNSIYEVSRADGSKSVTYYDANGRTFSREDYGQIHPHGQMGLGSDGRVVPHEHKITYNDKGFVTGRYYRKLSSNGKPIGDWIKEK
ncbi:VENN motif pre-toxin domain-containing protein [uncultured Gilliamella sp.]|uniref:VENN motif pre-toxin domain-containing protein n=1 Tax=uncultured Gilliamella sp. TaxID=1193505 RepID=UPI0025D7AACC|nr:VENN motif pre-toxin domain-containing protein [uncultured Gilliamella sp.]